MIRWIAYSAEFLADPLDDRAVAEREELIPWGEPKGSIGKDEIANGREDRIFTAFPEN